MDTSTPAAAAPAVGEDSLIGSAEGPRHRAPAETLLEDSAAETAGTPDEGALPGTPSVSTPLDIESDVEPAPESSDSALVPDAEAAAEPVVHLAERPRASIDKMLELLWQLGGTDLQLTVDARPTIRVHGDLHPIVDEPVLGPDDTQRLLAELLDADRQAIFADGHEHDFSFSWRNLGRVRGNAFRQRGSIAIALRLIPREVPTMAGLGLPQALYELVRQHQGLILFTGPTGSGKSTSLAAMINQINHDRACHIITIEDPIEYVHSHARSLVNQREVGTDTASFPQALRSVLREDPDVLLVGEMRDLDSIRFALTIAETGHLVFATLHTNDTAQSLGRIVDVFPGDQQAQIRTQLAAALTGIVYQRLIPRVGGGMVAAYEVLLATTAARNLIKEGKTHQLRNVLVTGQRDGMITLEQSLNALIRDGVISYESAESRSLYPKELERARPLMAGMPGAPHAAAAGSVPTGAATPAGSPSTAVPAGAAGPAWNGARS